MYSTTVSQLGNIYFSLVLFFFYFNLSTSNTFHFGITVDQSTLYCMCVFMLLYNPGFAEEFKICFPSMPDPTYEGFDDD